MAAAIAALLILPWLVLYSNASRLNANQLAQEVTNSHIRSLMGNHLLDVVSTDQHTVKPWFNGKLDFSPTVIDLTADAFPLIGGRLDYIGGRAVAAIVYQRNKHVINVYTWPVTAGDSPLMFSQHNGYHVIRWSNNGMNWIAVSDLNQQELTQFAGLLRSKLTR